MTSIQDEMGWLPFLESRVWSNEKNILNPPLGEIEAVFMRLMGVS